MAGPGEETAEGSLQGLEGTVVAAVAAAAAEGLAQGLGIDRRDRPLTTEDRVDFSSDQDQVGITPEAGGAGFIKPQANATAKQAPAGAVVLTAEEHSGEEGPLMVEQGRLGRSRRDGAVTSGGRKEPEGGGEVVAGGDEGIKINGGKAAEWCEVCRGSGIRGGHRQASTGPYWATAAPGSP